MGASRRRIVLRRAGAFVAAAAATGAAWFFLVREDGGGGDPGEPTRGVSSAVHERVRELSTEELVDQVLMLGFDGTDATATFLGEVRERALGAVLVGSANWTDSAQGTALVGELRRAGASGGRTPPLIVAAQEGGTYRAFADLPPAETALQVGDTGSVPVVERWARETSEGLRAAGFDLNLFPVADVATLDSPVADRAFSDDAPVAATMTAAAVRGCRAAGIACAPLHFPGLGASSQDTGQGPATVSLDEASLSARDLEPFRAAFSERAEVVVLSLAFYAAYDSVTPAALAEPVATGLLRDKLGFEGVAITDDLGSGAIKATYRVPQAAVEALAAGADLIQIGSVADQAGVRDALLAAVRSGELPEPRLAEAAARVLELKSKLGLLPPA